MHSYVYVDLNNDGQFAADELLSYSYSKGKNSLGQSLPMVPQVQAIRSNLPPSSWRKTLPKVSTACV